MGSFGKPTLNFFNYPFENEMRSDKTFRKLSQNSLKKFWCERRETVFLHPVQIIAEQQVDFVAQLVEHITFNDGALGSSPSGITKALIMSGLFLFLFLIQIS